MKYAIIIPDGCADEPQEALGGRTPLQAARTPHLDRVARLGVVGRADNVPRPLTPASDVATLSLFGYDPLAVYTGRAPLEAAALGVSLGPDDWAVRCNLVLVEGGAMRDFTAGHIGDADGSALIAALRDAVGGRAELPGGGKAAVEFHAGVGYRNLLVARGVPGELLSPEVCRTQPPHDIPDRPVAGYLPGGPGGAFLNALMERSKAAFADHPVNRARRAAGERAATQQRPLDA
jgi:2,3-bisphosphoglycerate-independent phosphoglycerate mutase